MRGLAVLSLCKTLHIWVGGVNVSLLLQQGRDVDVPADGLAVEATGEQITGLVLLVPGRAAHHAPMALRIKCNMVGRTQTKVQNRLMQQLKGPGLSQNLVSCLPTICLDR